MNIYHTILRKSHDFDAKFRAALRVVPHEINNFLDQIIDAANRIHNPQELERVLVIYRKWESILFRVFGLQHVSKTVHPREYTTISEKKYLARELTDVVFDQGDPETDLLAIISQNIDQSNSIHKYTLNAIDSQFVDKKEVYDVLESATENFRACDLPEARRNYRLVIDKFMHEPQLSATNLYFYSWALHGLGNVHHVLNNTDQAIKLYQSSVEIKKKIPGIPSIYKYITELKLLVTLGDLENTNDWHHELNHFAFVVINDKQSCSKINEPLYKNLLANTHYALARSYFYLQKDDEAKNYYDKATHLLKNTNDFASILRVVIGKGVISKRPNLYANKIESILSRVNSRTLRDPYIQRLGDPAHLTEVEMMAESFSKLLSKVFENYQITGLSAPSHQRQRQSSY